MLCLRHARASDLDALAALEAMSFPKSEAADRQRFRERLKVYPHHYWLLFDELSLVAFTGGPATMEDELTDEMYADTSCHRDDGPWQMIFSLCVHPDMRHMGLGHHVFGQMLKDTEALGRAGAVLTCKDALVPFYQSFGFVDEGVSESVHGGVTWRKMRLAF